MTILRRFAYWLIRVADWMTTRQDAMRARRNWQHCYDIASEIGRIKTTDTEAQRTLNTAKDALYRAASCFCDEE